MARVVLAAPSVPPPPPGAVWTGLEMTWTGWDGSVWDLVDPRVSGISLQAGVRGLGLPQVDRFVGVSPGAAGSRFRGSRTLEREVFWPLKVYSDAGSRAWIEHDRRLFATLDVDRPGIWTVRHPDGRERSLRVRFVSDGDGASEIDPALVGWAMYGLTGVAEQPFWAGELVTRPFVPSEPVSFIPEGGGPPFHVAEGSLAANSVIDNPGDQSAWVSWWLQASTSATLGVGDRVIDVPFEIDPGRMLVIDTDPTVRTAIEIDAPTPEDPVETQRAWVASQLPTGTDRTGELGPSTKFAAVPPGAASPLSITLAGTSASVRASLVPLYRRAW